MTTRVQYVPSPGPFRWKLFLLVVFIMGLITTAAIVLTLIAHPVRGGGVHFPTTQPIVRLDLSQSGHRNLA